MVSSGPKRTITVICSNSPPIISASTTPPMSQFLHQNSLSSIIQFLCILVFISSGTYAVTRTPPLPQSGHSRRAFIVTPTHHLYQWSSTPTTPKPNNRENIHQFVQEWNHNESQQQQLQRHYGNIQQSGAAASKSSILHALQAQSTLLDPIMTQFNPGFESHSQQSPLVAEENLDLPFDIVPTFQEHPNLALSVRLKMKQKLLDFGMHDIILGAAFPECGKRFEVTLDLSEWDDVTELLDSASSRKSTALSSHVQPLESDKKHVYKLQVDFTQMRICVGDFGVNIPFTLLCFRLPRLLIQRHTVAGTIVADLSFGVSDFKWKKENLELTSFHLGEEGKCFAITNKDTCLKTDGCGFCESTNQCMRTRQTGDQQIDECAFCDRCAYFTESEYKGLCLRKETCGWCQLSNDCEAGDSLGPYSGSSCVVSTMDSHELVGWSYEQKQDRTLASVFGALFGIVLVVLVFTLTAVGGYCVFRKVLWNRGSQNAYNQVE